MKYFNYEKFKIANSKSLKGLWNIFPIILGVLYLISIISIIAPKTTYGYIFSGHLFFDSVIGATLGSLLTGSPVTAYILGKGFLENGINLIAVTAFISAWTTVGIVQIPAESFVLGKKFSISRNVAAFLMSIVTAIITVVIINIF